MGERVKFRNLIANAQNGDQDAIVQLVHRFIPLIKRHSRRMGYEEAYADLIAWTVNAIHKYQLHDDTELDLLEQLLISQKASEK
jgi:DNA-directed RNA polymerase specialized sigma subunit